MFSHVYFSEEYCLNSFLLGVSRLQFHIPRVTAGESEHDVTILAWDSRTINGFCFDFPSPIAGDVEIIATCVE